MTVVVPSPMKPITSSDPVIILTAKKVISTVNPDHDNKKLLT